jgi:hypothetical protein
MWNGKLGWLPHKVPIYLKNIKFYKKNHAYPSFVHGNTWGCPSLTWVVHLSLRKVQPRSTLPKKFKKRGSNIFRPRPRDFVVFWFFACTVVADCGLLSLPVSILKIFVEISHGKHFGEKYGSCGFGGQVSEFASVTLIPYTEE